MIMFVYNRLSMDDFACIQLIGYLWMILFVHN